MEKMIYKCLNCERVYNKKQLNIEKTLESGRIIHLKYLCPVCEISNFELQKEVYTKRGEDVLTNMNEQFITNMRAKTKYEVIKMGYKCSVCGGWENKIYEKHDSGERCMSCFYQYLESEKNE